ncbi:MAG: GldG family protein, partial [Planctomycetota bacterium]
MNLLQRSILGTVLVLIITLCLGYVVTKQTVGVGVIDLTSNDRYTLTAGTHAILDKLQRPLTLKLYYARTAVNRTGYNQLAQFNNHYYYVRDLLRAMARYAGGKLTLEEYDPRPFSDAAEEADSFGIRAFPLGNQTNEVFYFGLVLTSDTGAREVIEFLHPNNQGSVEYKIVELIDRATHRKKSKIGVMSPLKVVGENLTPQMMQMRQMLNQPVKRSWAIMNQLRQRKYEIVEVATDAEEIPEDLDYLLVVHPKDFQDKTLFAIDQFVMGGGKAIIFVDPYSEVDTPPRDPRNQFAGMSYNRGSNLNKLLEAWGVRMEEQKFVGDRALAGRVRSAGGRSTTSYIGYVMLSASKECFNDSEIVSQGLNDVVMLYPGSLKRVEGRDTQVTILVRTTDTGNTWH